MHAVSMRKAACTAGLGDSAPFVRESLARDIRKWEDPGMKSTPAVRPRGSCRGQHRHIIPCHMGCCPRRLRTARSPPTEDTEQQIHCNPTLWVPGKYSSWERKERTKYLLCLHSPMNGCLSAFCGGAYLHCPLEGKKADRP